MLAEVAAGKDCDVVMAGLHLAAEDDAIKTKTHSESRVLPHMTPQH